MDRIDKINRYLKNLDWLMLIAIFLIIVIGLIFVYSATYNMSNFSKLFFKQIIAIICGFFVLFLFVLIDYGKYYDFSKYLYFFIIFCLVGVLIFGKTIRGAKSWFDFGFFSFQPTELARVICILVLAVFLDKNSKNIKSFFVFLKAILIVLPIIVLILMQPDFGGILVFFPIIFGMFYIANIPKIYLYSILIACCSIIIIPVARTFFGIYNPNFLNYITYWNLLFVGIFIFVSIYFILKFLKINFFRGVYIYFFCLFSVCLTLGHICDTHIKDYQRNRLVVFFSPESDRLGAGYNVIQSKICLKLVK